MSNRDRIARAAEEARLAAEEKVEKKKAPKPAKASKAASKPRSRSKEVRMKVVWVVYNASGKPVKTFPYSEKAAGEAESARLSSSTGQTHELRPTKVPMD